MQRVGLNPLIFPPLPQCEEDVHSLGPWTVTRTMVGLKHGKHSFEKEAIAMWTRTKHPTRGKNTSIAAFMVDLKHPQLLRKKSLSLSLKPWHSEIPPEIFMDEVRATVESLTTQMTFQLLFKQWPYWGTMCYKATNAWHYSPRLSSVVLVWQETKNHPDFPKMSRGRGISHLDWLSCDKCCSFITYSTFLRDFPSCHGADSLNHCFYRNFARSN